MLNAARYFYAVFLCQLAIEKALKGLYVALVGEAPPRTHNIVFLAQQVGLELPPDLADFLFVLNRASVMTRYPEELDELQKQFPDSKSREILNQSKVALTWLKTKLPKL